MRKRSYVSLLVCIALPWICFGLFSAPVAAYRYSGWHGASGVAPLVIRPYLFPINSAVLSPDGRQIALAYGDGVLRVWDTQSGRLVSTHIEARRFIYCQVLGWSADGKDVISTGYANPVEVWSASTGRTRFALQNISLPTLSRDDHYLVSIGKQASIVDVWDVATGRQLLSFDTHASSIDSFTWSPTARLLAVRVFQSTPNNYSQVQVWNIASGKNVLRVGSADTEASIVSWSSSDRLVAITRDKQEIGNFSTGGAAQVWNTVTARLVSTYPSPTGDPLEALAWSPDNAHIVSTIVHPGPTYIEHIWNAASGKVTFSYPGEANRLEWSSSGKQIVSWNDNQYGGSVLVWNAATGATVLALGQRDASVFGGMISPNARSMVVISSLNMQTFDLATGHRLVLYPVAASQNFVQWSRDGRLLVTSGYGKASVWQASANRQLSSFVARHQEERTVTWSPDGRQVAGADGATFDVGIWDTTTGVDLGDLSFYHEQLGRLFYEQKMAVAWSPDGAHIADSQGNGVVVWGNQPIVCADQACSADGGQHSALVTALSWSPDSTQLASASRDKTVLLRNINRQQDLLVYRGHSAVVTTVAWAPNGKLIASGSFDQTIDIWDTTSGSTQVTLNAHSPVASVAWSPNGTRLAAATQDGRVMIWDVLKQQLLLTYRGHSGLVASVAWSPDGASVASASADKTVRVWNATTGKTVYVYRGHTDTVLAVQWSPDGTRLASASSDGTIQIWQP